MKNWIDSIGDTAFDDTGQDTGRELIEIWLSRRSS